MILEQRVEELEKRVAALERQVQEQPKSSEFKLSAHEIRGEILFTGDDFLSEELKNSLIEEIDTLLRKYTNKNYGIHLIFV